MADKTPEWKLDSFDWLPLDKWKPEIILSDYEVKGKRYCKICDSFISRKRSKSHVKWHVQERQFVLAQRKKAAKEAARLAKIEKAKERKLLKERGLI